MVTLNLRKSVKVLMTLAAILLVNPAGKLAAQGPIWEVGAAGGGSIYLNKSFDARSGSATAGFGNSFGVSAWLGHNLHRYVSGEFRYTYQNNGPLVEAEGRDVTMSGRSHAVHYDVLVHTSERGASIRPFFTAGFGTKGYWGTGEESQFQPLQDYALLTRTSEWKPLVVFGGGVKIKIGERSQLRLELRDYTTPFPKNVVAPAPGADLGGWIHNLAPMVGFSVVF